MIRTVDRKTQHVVRVSFGHAPAKQHHMRACDRLRGQITKLLDNPHNNLPKKQLSSQADSLVALCRTRHQTILVQQHDEVSLIG
jgi:hypothetical protein